MCCLMLLAVASIKYTVLQLVRFSQWLLFKVWLLLWLSNHVFRVCSDVSEECTAFIYRVYESYVSYAGRLEKSFDQSELWNSHCLCTSPLPSSGWNSLQPSHITDTFVCPNYLCICLNMIHSPWWWSMFFCSMEQTLTMWCENLKCQHQM